MKKTKESGFTLIELLVAISILGLITIIAMPQISNLQNSNKETKYKKYADSLMTSAKLYTDSYSEDMFGYNTSGCYDISYADLKEKDLVKDIKINGESCAGGKDLLTYVRVYKSNTNYNYGVSIYCVDSDQQEVYSKLLNGNEICDGTKPDEVPPEIEISPNSSDTWKPSSDIKVTITISDPYGMLENTKIKYTWTKNPYSISENEYKEYNFKNKRYDDSLKLTVKAPKKVAGEYYLVVKPVDVRDANGNYQTFSETSGVFKIDDIAPDVPTVKMYQWSNNSTRPTSSDGLTEYINNTWSTKKVYTTASSSTDEGSGLDRYEYTTTGATTNHTNKTGTSRSIEADGISTIKYRACDKAGNCSSYTTTYTVNVDKTAPTLHVNVFKADSNKNKVETSGNVPISYDGVDNDTKTKTLEEYGTSNSWLNKAEFPNGVYYEISYYDNVSVATTEWSWNKTGLTAGSNGVNEYTGGIKTTTVNSSEEEELSVAHTLTGNGYRKAYYTVTDQAGNSVTIYITAPIDRTAPTVPTVDLYQWSDNDTRPTSAEGLTPYTNDTWSNKNIYTTASGSSDTMSGFKEYQYTTTGATENATNKAASYRSVEANGTSYIQYRACDKAGNCSSYGTKYTIKIDKDKPAVPTAEIREGSSSGTILTNIDEWRNTTLWWGNFKSTSSNIDHYEYSRNCTGTKTDNLDKSYTYSKSTDRTYCIRAVNTAGNVSDWSTPYYIKIDKTAPQVPTAVMRENNSSGSLYTNEDKWTNKTIWWGDFKANDQHSGIDHYEYSSGCTGTKNDNLKTSYTFSANKNETRCIRAVDNMGNESDWSSPYYFKIDKIAPNLRVSTYYKESDGGHKAGAPMKSVTANNENRNVDINKYEKTDTTNGWLNGRDYKYGVYYELIYSDNISVATREWKYNSSGLKENDSNVNKIVNGSGPKTVKENSAEEEISDYVTFTADGYRKGIITITDLAGNTTTANITAPIDKTAPSCTTEGQSTTWTKDNRTLSFTCDNDVMSGCKSQFSKTFNTTTQSEYIEFGDLAGNICVGNVDVYVDKDAPTAPELTSVTPTTNITVKSWNCTKLTDQSYNCNISLTCKKGTNCSYEINYGSTDKGSGVNSFEYKMTTNGTNPTSGCGSWTTNSSCGSVFFGTNPTTSTHWIRAKDKAGNTSPVLKMNLNWSYS